MFLIALWADRYNTWLLIKLTPKGVFFSLSLSLFVFFFSFFVVVAKHSIIDKATCCSVIGTLFLKWKFCVNASAAMQDDDQVSLCMVASSHVYSIHEVGVLTSGQHAHSIRTAYALRIRVHTHTHFELCATPTDKDNDK